ncbi:MAG: SCP2 sterol-binding domain-containing protein [Pseudomonadota bacterium]|nr:SCP2 sterol-binding domain-containing protein [Pseudomonadota bacterium]
MSVVANALAVVEAGLNRALALDPAVGERLRKLDGRVVAVTLTGLEQTVYCVPIGDRLQLAASWPEPAQVRLIGRVGDFARLAAAGTDKQAELLSGGVRIEGDAILAQRFAEVFDELDLDLEAPLERLFGPIAAHRMGQAARRFLGWGRQAAATLGEDAVEFLREETGDLVHAEDVEAWMDAVDGLRSDADRLEARIRRLERKLTEA